MKRVASGTCVLVNQTVKNITEFHIGNIGSVIYKEQAEIYKALHGLTLESPAEYWNQVEQAFFIKRQTFAHENPQRVNSLFCYHTRIRGQYN